MDSVYELQEPSSAFYSDNTKQSLFNRLDKLSNEVKAELHRQGFEDDKVKVERMLNMRFEGTDTALMVLPEEGDGNGQADFEAAFKRVYRSEFGFLLESKSVIVDDIKVSTLSTWRVNSAHRSPQVRGIGKTFDTLGESVYEEVKKLETRSIDCGKADSTYSVYFDEIGRVDDTPVFLLDDLETGDKVSGPAMIIDNTQTIVLIPGAESVLTSKHLYITIQ